MNDTPQVKPGDSIKIQLYLIRPLDREERVTFTTGETKVINNIREHLWWAGTRTDFPMVIVCISDFTQADIIRGPWNNGEPSQDKEGPAVLHQREP